MDGKNTSMEASGSFTGDWDSEATQPVDDSELSEPEQQVAASTIEATPWDLLNVSIHQDVDQVASSIQEVIALCMHCGCSA